MVGHYQCARVVVPAFRALHTIKQCVAAVYASEVSVSLDVVVVDDGDNPGLDELLKPFSVDIICSGRSGSAAIARNFGCRDASNVVIVFVDADVIVRSDCIARLIEPIILGETDASVGNYSADTVGLDFGGKYKQLYVSSIYDRRVGYLRNDFWTAVGAIDAAVFHDVGGFDPGFRGACGEDGDIGRRLTEVGYRILGVPSAQAQHRHPVSVSAIIENDWSKGVVALRNHNRSEGRLSDNKHATPRDVVSVIMAVAMLGSALCMPVITVAPLIILTSAYSMARADVIAKLAQGGFWFVCRAWWLMFVLDLLRFTCVLASTAERFPLAINSWSSRSPNHAQSSGDRDPSRALDVSWRQDARVPPHVCHEPVQRRM